MVLNCIPLNIIGLKSKIAFVIKTDLLLRPVKDFYKDIPQSFCIVLVFHSNLLAFIKTVKVHFLQQTFNYEVILVSATPFPSTLHLIALKLHLILPKDIQRIWEEDIQRISSLSLTLSLLSSFCLLPLSKQDSDPQVRITWREPCLLL